MNLPASFEILPAIDELKRQKEQRFPFKAIESFLNETRTSEICEQLGVSADLVNRFRDEGLGVYEADAMACKLHQHVGTIWPSWFSIQHIPDDVMDEIDLFLESHKQCIECEEWMFKSGNFYRRSASKDGYAPRCKACSKVYEQEKRRERGHRATN
jgi:hypothetical protein